MTATILILLVALGVVSAVAWPIVRGQPDQPEGAPPPDAGSVDLQDAIDRSLRAIREIEFDHRAGHLSDADFAALDETERRRATGLIRRRESHSSERDGQSG